MATRTYTVNTVRERWFPRFAEWLEDYVSKSPSWRIFTLDDGKGPAAFMNGLVWLDERTLAVQFKLLGPGFPDEERLQTITFHARSKETLDGETTGLVVIFPPVLVVVWIRPWLEMTKEWPKSFPLPCPPEPKGVRKRVGAPKGKNLGIPDYAKSLPKAFWQYCHEHGQRPTNGDLANIFGVDEKTVDRRVKDIRQLGGTWPPPPPGEA